MQNADPIECKFVQIPQHACLCENGIADQKLKSGKYHGSAFALPEDQKNKWPVCAYLTVNTEQAQGKNQEEIIDGCLAFLNKSRKNRKTKKLIYEYGLLTVYKYEFKTTTNFSYIEIILLTDDPKNKHFWTCRKKNKNFGGIPSGKKRKILKGATDARD